MFRRPRQTEADRLTKKLSETLHPINVIPWANVAMWYLGVPIVVVAPMMVVRDDDYAAAIEKLERAGFTKSAPNRTPCPEIMADHPDPQRLMEEINAGYKRVDRYSTVLDYPQDDPEHKGMQLYLFPDSFAHIFPDSRNASIALGGTASTNRFHTYGNLHYPLEPVLVESFVKAAIDEEAEMEFSTWAAILACWVSQMSGYLEVNNDILDHCEDEKAVEWYSVNFGRIYEAKNGPRDRRISKRLGSGKEMPVDMRGNPI
ncbi:hypothetical protein AbraIFM66951_012022 [Aspergillus brasiliensis]|uniref:Uncharacterized protein n=1 Tax=Aspergillus brasiliensis TaxID=319629 RepID=A0A9W6DPY3_9EURO|nr:hypothetical protein AbraCBS73388_011606 [Aspergillus brasiliensis]GKZ48259.1 hypothetical protein AbraIFM66951_012022 [Aspergillus brasiliensis]